MTDPSGPRPLSAVVDAYDADRGYLVSSSAPVTTSDGVSTTFSVVLDDQDAFASFSVRFLNADMDELPVSTGEPAMTSVAPLLADDALHPADFPELGERLALLGYLQDRGATLGGAVALEVVIRFRRDHGMRGVARVTLADLLALRATAPAVRRTTDLSAY